MMVWLRLFYEFFKTGLFAVGGGLATLPFLQEMATRTGWFTAEDIANMVAVSESTPGAIGINMSTYVGFITSARNNLPATLGAIISTLGLAAPSIIVIIIIAHFLKKFKDSPIVKAVFKALRPASMALITVAALNIAEIAFLHTGLWTGFSWESIAATVNWKAVILAPVLFFALRKFKKHPIWYIAASAVIGIVFSF